jgi:transcriptional regulator GlxA family with amidase domain
MKSLKLAILVYENCTASMVLGVLDIISLANAQGRQPIFDLEIISEDGLPIRSFSRFAIQPDLDFSVGDQYDAVYVPGFVGDVAAVLRSNKNAVDWLKKQHEGGAVLTAACNGNYLLADTGLLDGKRATTHWSLADDFRRRFRQVELLPEKIVVDNGDLISAAGVTAYFNLALFLIERYGSKELSLTCAKVFLVDSGRKIQTPYLMYNAPKGHGDEEIVRLQDWMEQHFQDNISLEKLETLGNLGKKTLTRRFKKATGDTPLVYLQKIRVENAKRMLESKNLSFNEITWAVGYGDASFFHRVFKSETGLTPMAYRERFGLV